MTSYDVPTLEQHTTLAQRVDQLEQGGGGGGGGGPVGARPARRTGSVAGTNQTTTVNRIRLSTTALSLPVVVPGLSVFLPAGESLTRQQLSDVSFYDAGGTYLLGYTGAQLDVAASATVGQRWDIRLLTEDLPYLLPGEYVEVTFSLGTNRDVLLDPTGANSGENYTDRTGYNAAGGVEVGAPAVGVLGLPRGVWGAVAADAMNVTAAPSQAPDTLPPFGFEIVDPVDVGLPVVLRYRRRDFSVWSVQLTPEDTGGIVG